MKLEEILISPAESLMYMERLVNDGSPSGFSFENITSKSTCPLFTEKFRVHKLISNYECFKTIGNIPENLCDSDNFIYIHPDTTVSGVRTEIANMWVVPTSSSRTVRCLDTNYYIKMAYLGVLGRITRELELKHINSSIDVTSIMTNMIISNELPKVLSFFPERSGRLYRSETGQEIGFVVRDAQPIGKNVHKIKMLIPAFSLFSEDKGNLMDKPIIIQILHEKKNKKEYVLNQLIFPILDCFFSCVFFGGLLLEMHSQNFLIGLDENLDVSSIVLRDLESVDKDITIMRRTKQCLPLTSYPFKCINDEQYNYKIKHSFMFDHKLGEYFFDQILNCLNKHHVFDRGDLEQEIKSYVQNKYGELLTGFFPEDGKWYKFKKIIIDRTISERPYISIYPPKYR